ncbi:hypothetical protein [Paraclostridium bifermentans]|uniref:hypothetical protein n=1 Tax=Paraclostridium bifermentans TaxID=1490 RepID=UPI00374FAC1A
MRYGILAILFGLAIVIKVNIYGSIWIVLGVYIIYSEISTKKSTRSEMDVSSIDRSEYVTNIIGGSKNIDINLSKYSDDSQLIVFKDKSILIGYNNFETEKIIVSDSIINVDIRVNKAIKGTSYKHTTNYNKELIESIFVYIHTNECTEELIFRYSSYEIDEAQIKYNEILKGLNRFKAMLDDVIHTDDLYNKSNIDIKEKYIPQHIKEYKELLDIDAITKEEYEAKKKELLSK